MPKLFRTMKKGEDDKPVVDATGKGLGVRSFPTSNTPDVDLDEQGRVILNDKGMSVAPDWRVLPFFLLPEPLRQQLSGAKKARGRSDLHCFTMGEGAFVMSEVAKGLDLKPDSPRHGVVVPQESVPLDLYQTDLANTRDSWTIIES
jgi:hypothetical protein